MISPIELHLNEIRDLCARHQVRKFYLFGSATRKDFDPAGSDLDFLVVFNDVPRVGFDDVYFKLAQALSDLFGRPVDLVEYGAIRNPYFKQEVIETRVPLHAA